ncbi:MAG: hypothetical protein LBH17_03695 [Oscillospiraceae bacterium]|jgi:hypothetical protein|nr:hypothetical protein [Oscillospiraceae bacterium]
MKLCIAVPGGVLPALDPRFEAARIMYRIRGSRLYCARRGANARGGIMVINASGYTGGGPVSALLEEIGVTVAVREFDGVVLDTGELDARRRALPLQAALASGLVSDISPRPVFVREALGKSVPGAQVLIQTALSAGSLSRHLSDAAERFGISRLALECDRIHMDFPLPCPDGAGVELDRSRFSELRERASRVFFSDALCVNYFFRAEKTSSREDSSSRMVLFDDAESMRRKLELAKCLGIERAFLYYPHVSDILPQLLPD